MSALPRGWVETTIGEVCNYIQRGKSPKYVESSALPVINQKCVRWAGIDERYLKYVDPEQWSSWTEERFLAPDDVLWNSTGTGTIGRAALFKGLQTADRAVVDSHVTILRTNGAVTGTFLHRFTQSPGVQAAIVDMQSGTTNQVELNRAEIIATALPLPPLAEQKRIVAKLDALNAKSARARTELARIETLVSRYKQAVLSKAFSGEFFSIRETGERREASKKRLSEICQSITDGDHQAPPKAPSGVPFITISAMNDGRIDLGKATRFVPESYYEELQSSRKARTGDILYSVTGSYGIPAIVETDRPFVFQRHISILRPDTSVASAKYLELLLASPEMRGQADAIATGTAQKTVPLKGLRNFEIPIPSLEEQHEIVRRIESAFAKIDRLVKEAKRALELVGRLDEAILAKAFRGELVPQDDNDEPAEHLLARIRTERETSLKVKSKRMKRVTTMPTAKDFLNTKLENWPADGVSFQDLRREFGGTYDDLKEAVFASLSGEQSPLQQIFDDKTSTLAIRKRER